MRNFFSSMRRSNGHFSCVSNLVVELKPNYSFITTSLQKKKEDVNLQGQADDVTWDVGCSKSH